MPCRRKGVPPLRFFLRSVLRHAARNPAVVQVPNSCRYGTLTGSGRRVLRMSNRRGLVGSVLWYMILWEEPSQLGVIDRGDGRGRGGPCRCDGAVRMKGTQRDCAPTAGVVSRVRTARTCADAAFTSSISSFAFSPSASSRILNGLRMRRRFTPPAEPKARKRIRGRWGCGLVLVSPLKTLVPGVGVEPTRLSSVDFESTASANSATRAGTSARNVGPDLAVSTKISRRQF